MFNAGVVMLFFLTFLFCSYLFGRELPADLEQYGANKEIPSEIENHALIALSHFPQLSDTDIRFIYDKSLKGPIMAARPKVSTLLGRKENRTYHILINPLFKMDMGVGELHRIPDSVMVGWIGHELGHIMDYEARSAFSIMGFGLRYWLSDSFIQKAELVADGFAVDHGMADYLVAKKKFILYHEELPTKYIKRIARLYPSPDDIHHLVTLMAELEEVYVEDDFLDEGREEVRTEDI